MTYKELQESKTATLEDKAQHLHDNCTDYMVVTEGILINEGDGEVWLCNDNGLHIDGLSRIRQIAVFIGYNDEGLAMYKGISF